MFQPAVSRLPSLQGVYDGNKWDDHQAKTMSGSRKVDAHRLKGLEGTVEEEVPHNFPIFKGGDVEYEEVAEHSQRG